jgi:hypothetical protein
MNDQHVEHALGNLLECDRRAVALYDEVEQQSDDELARTLVDFRHDHQRRIERIEELCTNEGIEPLQPEADVVSLLDENQRLTHAVRGREALLESLLIAELANAAFYATVESLDLPSEVADVIADHHAEEGLHTAFIAGRVPALPTLAAQGGQTGHEVTCFTGGLTDDINPDDLD